MSDKSPGLSEDDILLKGPTGSFKNHQTNGNQNSGSIHSFERTNGQLQTTKPIATKTVGESTGWPCLASGIMETFAACYSATQCISLVCLQLRQNDGCLKVALAGCKVGNSIVT